MQLLVETKPITDLVLRSTDVYQPFIVWLPNLRLFVSALPLFDIEGNVEKWVMTDKDGGSYGIALDDVPSHYVDGLNATAIEQGSASLPVIEVTEEPEPEE